MLTGRLSSVLENLGHKVGVFSKDNLIINNKLLDHELIILKSKKLVFLYAGFFITSHKIPIFPPVQLAYQHKNRIEAHYLIREAKLNSPNIYLASREIFIEKFQNVEMKFIQKPIMGSGSQGIKLLDNINDLKSEDERILYLERFVEGIHYLAYFIGEKIQVFEKVPLADEHSPVQNTKLTTDLKTLIMKWKNKYDLSFGHLDIVREEISGKLFIVDVGCFPEFTHWKNEVSPENSIVKIILNKYYEKTGNRLV